MSKGVRGSFRGLRFAVSLLSVTERSMTQRELMMLRFKRKCDTCFPSFPLEIKLDKSCRSAVLKQDPFDFRAFAKHGRGSSESPFVLVHAVSVC